MKISRAFIFIVLAFPLFVAAQTLDEKLKEIDDYANQVVNTWKGPGMAIAVDSMSDMIASGSDTTTRSAIRSMTGQE